MSQVLLKFSKPILLLDRIFRPIIIKKTKLQKWQLELMGIKVSKKEEKDIVWKYEGFIRWGLELCNFDKQGYCCVIVEDGTDPKIVKKRIKTELKHFKREQKWKIKKQII